jgi:ketopantoate reductase
MVFGPVPSESMRIAVFGTGGVGGYFGGRLAHAGVIAAGKPSELESHNGAVVRMAQEFSIDVATHAFIYETLRPLEEKARATA